MRRLRHPRPPRANNFFLLLPTVALWLLATARPEAQSLGPIPPATAGQGASKKIFEEWALLLLDGKRCGYDSTVAIQIHTPTGLQFHTEQEEQFVIRRMNSDLKITEISKTTEDADGGVLAFEERTKGAGSDILSSGVRQGDDLIVTSRGQTVRYKIPRLAALGPEAVRRLSDAMPLKEGQTYSFPTFENDYPQAPVIDSGIVVGQETRKVGGATRQVWRLATNTSLMPGLSGNSWVDDKGNDVESILIIPGIGHLDQIVTTRADCMKQPEGAEIFSANLLRPQRALPAPHRLAEATYRLTSGDATQQFSLWNEGEQRVLSSRPGVIEIEVTAPEIGAGAASYSLPHADTPELHPYLMASAYLESNSPEIKALARQAVGDERNPVLAADRIEHFVRAYITKKDLDIGFASAEETARSREGDCTEHAVLCAALGRAVGLPTRCVLGFGYIPPGVDEPTIANAVDRDTGIFGFHMWAEAWVAPHRWVAMDAALDGFDVGHIAILKTALAEVNPLVDLNMPILQLMQKLRIDILQTKPKPAYPPAGPAGVD